MKIISKSLEKTLEHLASNSPDEFPADHPNQCYWDRYRQLAVKLNKDWHPNVAAGSQAADGGGMLTDHGPDHIRTVISRASCLLDDSQNDNELSGYEIYLLLCAIHFHDLGNIYGRVKHEKVISEMMENVKDFLGDAAEKKYIREIAEVHGGKVGADKDTISHLPDKAALNGLYVRLQLLASILRFADELADDQYRANRILLKLDKIPDSSIIYHKFAECLNSVMIRPKEKDVSLHFHINIKDFINKYPKPKTSSDEFEQVYILDEIFDRIIKSYSESLYCNRFSTPFVDIRSLSIEIICLKDKETIGDKLPKIKFILREKGYPSNGSGNIHQLTDELNNWGQDGSPLTGAIFADQITNNYFPGGGGSE
jgi:hypothetical protein